MKWRTDKPTADVIVAKLKCGVYDILYRDEEKGKYFSGTASGLLYKRISSIEKWADLEEDETVTECKKLEKEIQTQLEVQLCGGYGGWNDGLTDAQLKDFARYFAKWGAEHLKK